MGRPSLMIKLLARLLAIKLVRDRWRAKREAEKRKEDAAA